MKKIIGFLIVVLIIGFLVGWYFNSQNGWFDNFVDNQLETQSVAVVVEQEPLSMIEALSVFKA